MATNHLSMIRDPELRQELKRLLYVQQDKVRQIAFLAPDVDHVFRVHTNARRLMVNALFHARLEEQYGRAAVQVVLLASLLSKVGFGHPDLDPGDSATYSHKG